MSSNLYNVNLDEISNQRYRYGYVNGGVQELVSSNPGWSTDHVIIGRREEYEPVEFEYAYNCPRDIVVYFHQEHMWDNNPDDREYPKMILYNTSTQSHTNANYRWF